jgi:hypothetical protein
MEIQYYQKGGRIGATYKLSHDELDRIEIEDLVRFLPSENPWYDDIDIGLVPEEVQAKGKKEIRKYVERVCRERHEKHLAEHRKIRDDYYHRMANVNHEIRIQYSRITLVGRITRHEDGILVRLEEPFVCKGKGYALCDTMGHPLFDHEGNLTEETVAESKELLTKLYDEKINRRKHGKTVQLIEGLNGTEDAGE